MFCGVTFPRNKVIILSVSAAVVEETVNVIKIIGIDFEGIGRRYGQTTRERCGFVISFELGDMKDVVTFEGLR